MDRPSSTRISVTRQPLGDATQRVANVSVANSHQRHRSSDARTAKSEKAVTKPAARKRSTRQDTDTNSSQYEMPPPPRPPVEVAVEAVGESRRLSSLSIGSRELADAKRVSQFSNVSSTASSTRQLKTHIGPWHLGKTLGKGSSARVRLARHRVTHQLVAIKIVPKQTAHLTQAGSLANVDRADLADPSARDGTPRMPLAIEREVAILKLIEHPNIIKLYDIWENRSEIYLVTEYVERGDMFGFINHMGRLGEEEAVWYFRQMMRALEYCHSFNICHRDLKPENILLKADGTIKIADFGMAALHQGPAHQLKTACGSPHYAAPELLRHQYYNGSAADIWSMGVILFAMLAGHLPFDEPELPLMLSKAKKAEYQMPSGLSREAADLIRKILVIQPETRITMKQMWRHPLLRKYDYLDDHLAARPQDVQRDIKIGPIADDAMDPQILRQLKALWHAYSEDELKRKLRSEKPNDQKLFYWLLYKYRETQLENYNSDCPISKADYHHLKPPNRGKRISTCQFMEPARYGQGKTISLFTVISNFPEKEEVGTMKSYDPYNASRVLQPCASEASHAKITVHRGNPDGGVLLQRNATTISHSYHSYRSVGGSFRQRKRMNSQRTTTTAGNVKSLNSLSSIQSSRQGTPRVHANQRYKRGVDFSVSRARSKKQQKTHERRNSRGTQRAPASIAGDNTTYRRDSTRKHSPLKGARGRQNLAAPQSTTMPAKRKDDDSFTWNEELRQLGHVIAKDCDEAFRSSLLMSDSSVEGSREGTPFSFSLGGVLTQQQQHPETPVSSALANGRKEAVHHLWDSRPLPPPPPGESETPRSVQTNYLIHAQDSSSPNVAGITMSNSTTQDRRVVSAPDPAQKTAKFAREGALLSSVYESTPEGARQSAASKQRIVSAPPETPGLPTPHENRGLDFLTRKPEQTIRVVNSPAIVTSDSSSVKAPKPLNLRKKSSCPPMLPETPRGPPPQSDSADWQTTTGATSHASHASHVSQTSTAAPAKKRMTWFKRASRENVSASESGIAILTETSIVQSARPSSLHGGCGGDVAHPYRTDSQSTSGPAMVLAAKKKSFNLSFWRSSKNEPRMSLAGPDYEETPSPEAEKVASSSKHTSRATTAAANSIAGTSAAASMWNNETEIVGRQIEVHQNWLARLFRVKPATRHLCFAISKRRARQEIAILLREWRKYGIKDVEVDKDRNLVFARVSARNYLHIKEVAFAAEIMTVIEHGKRNHLAIVRCTQERGAASSFHKVVDTMSNVFTGRGLLVADKRKAKMMIKTLNS